MVKLGFIHGRFQLFHNDHLNYALLAKEQCEKLIVGITSPENASLIREEVDPHRSEAASNPFTYYERYNMVKLALLEAGIKREDFEIVPYPIERPEILYNYVPLSATSFFTIYDQWGYEKLNRLKALGYGTVVLFDDREKKMCSTEIRQKIVDRDDWKQMVPESVYEYIMENDLTSKVKQILQNNKKIKEEKKTLFDVSTIPEAEKERITNNLAKWGIGIDQETGKIDYIEGTVIPEMKCKSIHLIRHAETEAVIKHEFMSDTSDNCGFTEDGIEITHKQARELDVYDFDIALYGPIPRVVNTKELVMQIPQKFECVRVEYLHGINNTGWEYKSFYDLENDPTFIAREIENNMFARTPNGSSWGTVIANCADVFDLINEKYVGKKILLISQGSVLRAMQILLRKRKHPWDDFTVSGMYHVGDDSKKKKDYGIINQVF